MELTGKFPTNFSKRALKSKHYFNEAGYLKKIPELHYWPFQNVLTEKYRFKPEEARLFSSFMLCMLNPCPEKRFKAAEMLSHPWILSEDKEYVKMNEEEFKNYLLNKKKLENEEPDYLNKMDQVDSDAHGGGSEDNENSSCSGTSSFYGHTANIDVKLVDRSFTNMGYIGFGEGIDLDALDNTGNWQFENI